MSSEPEPKWRSFLTKTEIVLTSSNLLLEKTDEQKRTKTYQYVQYTEKYALLQNKRVLKKCFVGFTPILVPNSIDFEVLWSALCHLVNTAVRWPRSEQIELNDPQFSPICFKPRVLSTCKSKLAPVRNTLGYLF